MSSQDNKPKQPDDDAKRTDDPHPGMMGDGTMEQNLDQPGDPKARITKDEVEAAFGQDGDQAGDKG